MKLLDRLKHLRHPRGAHIKPEQRSNDGGTGSIEARVDTAKAEAQRRSSYGGGGRGPGSRLPG